MIDATGKERVNCFRKDERFTLAQTADPSDYDEPRFDQGHMANDADMKYDLIEQVNSYVMSNMSPQECRFNRGTWLSLEKLTRLWATKFDTIFVNSGAIFDRNGDSVREADSAAVRMASRNGLKRVAVPTEYYRVILREDGNNEFKSIAFLLQEHEQRARHYFKRYSADDHRDNRGEGWPKSSPILTATSSSSSSPRLLEAPSGT